MCLCRKTTQRLTEMALQFFRMAYLKQLNANDCEHELQQTGDEHNVADSFDSHDYALDDVLWLLG